MRIEINDPGLVPSLLEFLRRFGHVTAEQIGPLQVEVSQLGSMNTGARRLELDLMLQTWRERHREASVEILG